MSSNIKKVHPDPTPKIASSSTTKSSKATVNPGKVPGWTATSSETTETTSTTRTVVPKVSSKKELATIQAQQKETAAEAKKLLLKHKEAIKKANANKKKEKLEAKVQQNETVIKEMKEEAKMLKEKLKASERKAKQEVSNLKKEIIEQKKELERRGKAVEFAKKQTQRAKEETSKVQQIADGMASVIEDMKELKELKEKARLPSQEPEVVDLSSSFNLSSPNENKKWTNSRLSRLALAAAKFPPRTRGRYRKIMEVLFTDRELFPESEFPDDIRLDNGMAALKAKTIYIDMSEEEEKDEEKVVSSPNPFADLLNNNTPPSNNTTTTTSQITWAPTTPLQLDFDGDKTDDEQVVPETPPPKKQKMCFQAGYQSDDSSEL
jgi:hypothetical protein